MSLHNRFNQSTERLQDVLTQTGHRFCLLMKIGPESSLRVRRRQFLWGGCLVMAIIVFVYGAMNVLLDRGPIKQHETPSKPVETNIATAPKHINMEEARWHALDEAIKKLGKEVTAIKQDINGEDSTKGGITVDLPGNTTNPNFGETDSTDDQSNIQNTPSKEFSHNDPRFEQIQERLAVLEIQRAEKPQHPLNNPYAQNSGNPEEQDGRIIQKFSISLSPHSKNQKTFETAIPAGAFAKTVLLSGLDASSAMNASSDPRPMLLRIIDHGTLPRRFQSDLKDCHCTAGAYGDLSSERVYARLEKLTCIDRQTGEIIETQVAGYVAGSDGKAGIRGVVASKDGQFLARSLMGGVFAGLSNVANPQNRKAQINPFVPGTGGSVPAPSIGENFMGGMASGATTALDRLSQYYIDRAEQLQPVIQITAGQVVDIVFTEGASLLSNQSSVVSHQNAESNNNTSSVHNHKQQGE